MKSGSSGSEHVASGPASVGAADGGTRMRLSDLVSELTSRQTAATDLLRKFVEIESGSYDKAGVDRVGNVLATRFEALGFGIERLPQESTGDHLIATRRGSGRGRLLILIHLDTVWPPGTLEEFPFEIRDGRATGPGVLDMKGGWVVLLSALEALRDSEWESYERITVFMTGDEELGSPTGRGAIERLAREHEWALVLEPARESGAFVTQRGAVGAVFVDVEGVTAHAMGSTSGASAIIEAAHLAIALEQLTDREHGVIVNIGILSGGSARQVVPDRARLTIDLRAPNQEKADSLIGRVTDIVNRRTVPGTRAALSGGITRPAYASDQADSELYRTAVRCAHALGIAVGAESTRGGSDANFTAALGIPTLDGLGPEGGNGCTRSEYVLLDSLPRRSGLLASVIAETAAPGSVALVEGNSAVGT